MRSAFSLFSRRQQKEGFEKSDRPVEERKRRKAHAGHFPQLCQQSQVKNLKPSSVSRREFADGTILGPEDGPAPIFIKARMPRS